MFIWNGDSDNNHEQAMTGVQHEMSKKVVL
jgi:hypothetical protein